MIINIYREREKKIEEQLYCIFQDEIKKMVIENKNKKIEKKLN